MTTRHQSFLDKLQGKPIPQCPSEERYPGIQYALKPSITLVVGRKGMGKSQMIVSLLKDPKGLKFLYDRIIIFSGTFKTQYEKLWSKLSPKGIVVFEDLDETVLTKVYEEQLGSQESVCIISDDMDEQWRRLDSGLMNRVITNSRHCNLSLIFLVQKLTQLPTTLRSNSDCVVAYATSCHREFTALHNEFSHCGSRQFHQFFVEATKEPYSFLVCCVQGGKVGMYINWSQKIY